MRILLWDKKKNHVKLVPEALDDLWHLLHLINPGDLVYGRTTREVKVRESTGEDSEGKRFPMYLGIRAKEASLNRHIGRLRVKGIVVEAPERFKWVEGDHHTITIKVGDSIDIIKPNWMRFEVERLETSMKSRRTRIAVLSIDDEDCCLAILRDYGFDIKAEWKLHLPGKGSPERREASLAEAFKEISSSLPTMLGDETGILLLVGPGFLKQRLAEYIQKNLHDGIRELRVAHTSVGGIGGVHEALRSGLVTKYVSEAMVIVETRIVEDALRRLSSGGLVTYGHDAVKRAADLGAVESLLVSDRLLREASTERWEGFYNLLRQVEEKGGRVIFISSGHEAGEKLWALGGFIALLRFRIPEGGEGR
ncbi:mRNA surveillance protein pelota [Candidatus Bathyarchaeota archaeon]|nr:mRNA surveillance protein pelota [Candidatus Bathyarchaeota archaeon]MBS7627275.1 mRNA surveillance protein pelota [Candidatus Bathyarchaeota archaeon]